MRLFTIPLLLSGSTYMNTHMQHKWAELVLNFQLRNDIYIYKHTHKRENKYYMLVLVIMPVVKKIPKRDTWIVFTGGVSAFAHKTPIREDPLSGSKTHLHTH